MPDLVRDLPQPQQQRVSTGPAIQVADPFALGAPFPNATPGNPMSHVQGAIPDGPVRDTPGMSGGNSGGFIRSNATRIPMRTGSMPGGLRFGATAAEHNANARLIAQIIQQGFGTPRPAGSGGTRSTDPRGGQTIQGNEALAMIQNNGFGNPNRGQNIAGSQQARGTATAAPQVNQPGVFDVFGGEGGITPGSSPFMGAFRGRF